MRITIDATSLLLRSAGIKNYTYYWLKHLRRAARAGEEIRAYPLLGDVKRLDHEASALSFAATVPRLGVLFAVNKLGSWALDAAIAGSDVFHASNQVHHAPRRAKLTATVHDLTAMLMPELHTAGNVRADAVFAERILKRADGLIAVSENSRSAVISRPRSERASNVSRKRRKLFFVTPPGHKAGRSQSKTRVTRLMRAVRPRDTNAY